MILVTGAAGKSGMAVIEALAARGERVHAFVHRESHIGPALTRGASMASVGSLHDADGIARALKGARAIYHICPNVSPNELRFGHAAAEGAVRAGVRRFIYHSVLHPQVEAMPHHWEKMKVEAMLFASGLDVTILQPTAYMQNLRAGWTAIVNEGVLRVPYPAESRISLVDLDDVAEAAAIVLADDTHVGATYELVGTPPLSQTAVAEVIGKTIGRPVLVESETPDDWATRARASGMDEHRRETLVRMFRYYASHGLVGNPNTLRWLLGRAPTSLPAFVRRAESR